jgi:hypothetical protein
LADFFDVSTDYLAGRANDLSSGDSSGNLRISNSRLKNSYVNNIMSGENTGGLAVSENSRQKQDLMNIYESLGTYEQAQLIIYAYELKGKNKKTEHSDKPN